MAEVNALMLITKCYTSIMEKKENAVLSSYLTYDRIKQAGNVRIPSMA